MSPPGLIVAAPASGCGKTLVTLALLRHFRNRGLAVGAFKVGPDFIDPAFHQAACCRPSRNLDAWAMRPVTLAATVADAAAGADLLLGEGMMGLFDGAPDGTGATADVAALLRLPVLLVVDVQAQAASAAAVIRGFREFRSDIDVAGVLFNNVGGEGHQRLLMRACGRLGVALLGFLPNDPGLRLPERHLGLVQAGEHRDLDGFLESAAAHVARHADIEAIRRLARPVSKRPDASSPPLPALGQRIAVAQDAAFGFAYASVLDGWRRAGADVLPFSPLQDEAPDAAADAVYLPGGYPELHAGRLAANQIFLSGLRRAAADGATIYGECGGYMVLGAGLIDAGGTRHAMAGLLPLESSFRQRRLHIGYRQVELAARGPLGRAGAVFRGHEFHFASILREDGDRPLFRCRDASGADLGAAGAVSGRIAGSFTHLIDRSD